MDKFDLEFDFDDAPAEQESFSLEFAEKVLSMHDAVCCESAPVQKTLVTMLLDRSGSMELVRDETISAINGYLRELRHAPGDLRFTMVQFDDGPEGMDLRKVHVARRIAEVPELTPQDYEPRGTTPLIDAACTVIRAVEDSLHGRTCKVVIAIQTDGLENASHCNDWNDLKALIDRKRADGWQFVFMGCGIDAYDQGRRMGLGDGAILSYGKDEISTEAAFRETAHNTVAFASDVMSEMVYSMEQKQASGDAGAGHVPDDRQRP